MGIYQSQNANADNRCNGSRNTQKYEIIKNIKNIKITYGILEKIIKNETYCEKFRIVKTLFVLLYAIETIEISCWNAGLFFEALLRFCAYAVAFAQHNSWSHPTIS
jgi:hypothetical protein